mgnify:CR=1
MAHAVQRPSILYDQNRYPLWLVVNNKQNNAKNQCESINDKKGDVKTLLVARLLFIVGYV